MFIISTPHNHAVDIIFAAVAAVASLAAIAVTFRGRQFTRPRLRLHVGVTGFDPVRQDVASKYPKRVVIYGVPDAPRDYIVLPVVFGVENKTSLPISSIRLQVGYPAECVIDRSRIVDDLHGPIEVGELSMPGRTAQRFGDIGQVTFDIEISRAREKLSLHEVVRAPRGCVPAADDDRHQKALAERWLGLPGFLSALRVELSLWAANADPTATMAIVAVCRASNQDELTATATAMFAHLWGEYKPVSPKLRRLLWWRKSWSPETAELVLLPRDALGAVSPFSIDPTILRQSQIALLQFALPPWGFTGTPFTAPFIERKS